MAAIELPQLQEATKKTAGFPTVFEIPGSPGRIRTCDTLINSQLRYHCATGEYVLRCLRARKNYTGICGACNPEFQKNWCFERSAGQKPNKIEVKAADPSSVSLQAPSSLWSETSHERSLTADDLTQSSSCDPAMR